MSDILALSAVELTGGHEIALVSGLGGLGDLLDGQDPSPSRGEHARVGSDARVEIEDARRVADQARAVDAHGHGEALEAHVVEHLVEAPLEEGAVDGAEGLQASGGESGQMTIRSGRSTSSTRLPQI